MNHEDAKARKIFILILFVSSCLCGLSNAAETIKRDFSWSLEKNKDPVIEITNQANESRTVGIRLVFGSDNYRYPTDAEVPAGETRFLRIREIHDEIASRHPEVVKRTSGLVQLEFEGTNRDLRTRLIGGKRGGQPARRLRYESEAPVITYVDPDNGSMKGGYRINIKGRNFKPGVVVQWNTAPVNARYQSSESLSIAVPSGHSGSVSIEVINPDKKNFILQNAFTYKGLPHITSVTPSMGNSSGGYTITVYGNNFDAGCSVLFGDQYGQTTYINPGAVAAIVPGGQSGAVNISVTTKEGDKDTLEDAFIYNEPPRILSIQADPDAIVRNATSTITVKAADPEAGPMEYQYRVAQGPSGGTVSGQGEQAIYHSPNTIGTAIIQVTVLDEYGAHTERTVEIKVQ